MHDFIANRFSFSRISRPSTTNEAISRHGDNEYHAAETLGRNEEDCGTLFPECKFQLLEQFTDIFF